MRQPIETAPRDGKFVILEDDASGTYDVAHWSAETGLWLKENGEPGKIRPTHWYLIPRDQDFPKYFPQEHVQPNNPSRIGPSASRVRRNSYVPFSASRASPKRSAVIEIKSASSIVAILIAAVIIDLYSRSDVADYAPRYAHLQDGLVGGTMDSHVADQATLLSSQSHAASLANDIAPDQPTEADQSKAPVEHAMKVPAPQAPPSPENDQRADVLSNELAEARRTIDELNLQLRTGAVANFVQQPPGQERDTTTAFVQDATAALKELTASTVQLRRPLEEEPAHGSALANELAIARREIEAEIALLRKAAEVHFKQTAEGTPAESKQEREKAEAETLSNDQRADVLSNELAEARRTINELNLQLHTVTANFTQLLGQERDKAAARLQDAGDALQELTASTVLLHQSLEEERAHSSALASELDMARREIEARKAGDDAAEGTTAESKQERDKAETRSNDQRAEALTNEIAEARTTINELNLQLRTVTANFTQLLGQERDKAAARLQDTGAARQELTASTGLLRQSLEEERARGSALASELDMARREIEAQAALSRKAADDAIRFKRAAERTTAELQQERDKVAAEALSNDQRAEALTNELAEARTTINELNLQRTATANFTQLLGQQRDKAAARLQDAGAALQELTASTVPLRQSLEEERARGSALASELDMARREIEAQAALSRKAADDAMRFKQAAERTTAELQQERDKVAALSREPVMASDLAQRAFDAPIADSQFAQGMQAVQVPASEQPVSAVSQVNPEIDRLIARANALIVQGNIGAARIVLEHAAETGSAKASFTLAETYDPGVLSTWGTYGTRGDASKARELYAKAHAGGIEQAKDRLNSLR